MIKIILCLHTVHFIKKIKLDYYRGKDCMNNFCLDLREHATKIINNEKKKKRYYLQMKKKKKFIVGNKNVTYAKKRFSTDYDNKTYHKVRHHCHYTGK